MVIGWQTVPSGSGGYGKLDSQNQRGRMLRIRMPTFFRKLLLVELVWAACSLFSLGTSSHAEISYDNGQDTVFAHSQTSPLWISGQGNSIFQWHPRFSAQYSGPHSFERGRFEVHARTLQPLQEPGEADDEEG